MFFGTLYKFINIKFFHAFSHRSSYENNADLSTTVGEGHKNYSLIHLDTHHSFLLLVIIIIFVSFYVSKQLIINTPKNIYPKITVHFFVKYIILIFFFY